MSQNADNKFIDSIIFIKDEQCYFKQENNVELLNYVRALVKR